MTGGYGMHIHSYQIHNVLNVYRQQLSRGTARNVSGRPDSNKTDQDRVDISDHGQRQTLFEKISSEIVQRITQFGPDTEIEAAISGQLARAKGPVRDEVDAAGGQGPAFSYTLIDKNNRKTTHNLSVRQLNFSTNNLESLIKAQSDGNIDTGSE
jgi:hypothetical protein